MRPGLVHLAPVTVGQSGVAVEDGVQDAVTTSSGKVKAKHPDGPEEGNGEGIKHHASRTASGAARCVHFGADNACAHARRDDLWAQCVAGVKAMTVRRRVGGYERRDCWEGCSSCLLLWNFDSRQTRQRCTGHTTRHRQRGRVDILCATVRPSAGVHSRSVRVPDVEQEGWLHRTEAAGRKEPEAFGLGTQGNGTLTMVGVDTGCGCCATRC